MLFYGDEVGYLNDYTYLEDAARAYDNRWMHRPLIDWEKNSRSEVIGTVEFRLYQGMKKLLGIRQILPVVADQNNHQWLYTDNKHIAAFMRTGDEKKPLYCFFNFSGSPSTVNMATVTASGKTFLDHWTGNTIDVSAEGTLSFDAYQFYLLEEL